MALENVGFDTWCIKDIRKIKSGPEKKWGLQFLIPGALIALEIFGLFQLLQPVDTSRDTKALCGTGFASWKT